MATNTFNRARITGIATAVPERVIPITDSAAVFGEDAVSKIGQSIGVINRRSSEILCTSDLVYAAAERLLADLGVPASEVEALIFVTQTPDYRLPASACLLQKRLGASKGCAAFDVNQGCSGYVYGLWLAHCLVEAGAAKKVLLLVGDTSSRLAGSQDRSTAMLFGDAGTASMVERDDSASPAHFHLGTDGSGAPNLIVPAGAYRLRPTPDRFEARLRADGNLRADTDVYMNGAEIFAFTLREVPKMISQVLAQANWTKDMVDHFVMHQANQFMLKHLAKRMALPTEKVPLSIADLGNTSSASIPATMTHSLISILSGTQSHKLLLAGFGVGYSWGAAALTLQGLVMPSLIEVSDGSAPPALIES